MADSTITLVGNLTRDPELKFLDSGLAAVKFSLAVNRKWKDNRGEEKEQVSYFDCSALGSIAENIAQPQEGRASNRHGPTGAAHMGDPRGREAISGRGQGRSLWP
jgi:hypothetical protein